MRKLLLVDDEPRVLSSLARQLKKDFEVTTAESAQEALKIIANGNHFAAILTDMRMPGMTGLELLGKMQTVAPDTVRMMLTGNADQQTAMDAINHGRIFRFFNKPVETEFLKQGLEEAVRQYELITAEKILLEKTLAGSVKVLVDILSIAHPTAFGRATKTQGWVEKIARSLGLSAPWHLKMAAMLSDLGQIAMPDGLVEKLDSGKPLTTDEEEIVRSIPKISHDLIKNIPRMEAVAKVVLYQNKGFDGSGYPDDSIKGHDIPMGSRLLKILKDVARITSGSSPTALEIKQLSRWEEKYDPELLKKVTSYFLNLAPKTESSKVNELKKLSVSALLPGYTVLSHIELENGRLILVSGSRLTKPQVEKLRNIGKVLKIKEPVLVDVSTREKDSDD